MTNRIKMIWGQSETTFDSPYPLKQCRQIIADYENMGGIKQSVRLVDVYAQDDGTVGFTIRRNLMADVKVKPSAWSFNGKITGTLTPTETGTQVAYRAQVNWIVWAIYSILFFIIPFFLLAAPAVLVIQHIPSSLFIFVLMGLLSSLLGIYPPINRIRHFVRLIDHLLGDKPARTPDTLRPNRLFTFHQRFDFYTNQTLPVCMKRLSLVIADKHYQLTPLGVLEGSTSEDGFFTGYHKVSNELVYFWIAENKHYTQRHTRYIFGQIQVEDNHVRVSGFSQGTRPLIYMVFLGLVVAGMMFIIPNVAVLVGLLGYLQIYNRFIHPIKQLGKRVANKIEGEADSPTKPKWFWQARTFDFQSPYPIDDCVNMLFDYSTQLGDYQTDDGRGKGAVVGDLLVVIYEKDSQPYQFTILPKSARSDPLGDYIRVIGSLQTQGHGTRVRGRLRNRWGNWIYAFLLLIMIICALPMLISWAGIVIWAGMALIITPIYLSLRKYTKSLYDYPQAVLSGKTNRKRKLADEQ